MSRGVLRQQDGQDWKSSLRVIAEVYLDGEDLAQARKAIMDSNEAVAKAAVRGFVDARQKAGRLSPDAAGKALSLIG